MTVSVTTHPNKARDNRFLDRPGLTKRVRVKLESEVVTITDTGGANGGYGTLLLHTFDATKEFLLLGAIVDLVLTGDGVNIGATAAVDAALGTVAESTDATLDSTQANIVAKVDAPFTASVGNFESVALAGGVLGLRLPISTAHTVRLNLGVPDADISANGTITVDGEIELSYLELGVTPP